MSLCPLIKSLCIQLHILTLTTFVPVAPASGEFMLSFSQKKRVILLGQAMTVHRCLAYWCLFGFALIRYPTSLSAKPLRGSQSKIAHLPCCSNYASIYILISSILLNSLLPFHLLSSFQKSDENLLHIFTILVSVELTYALKISSWSDY